MWITCPWKSSFLLFLTLTHLLSRSWLNDTVTAATAAASPCTLCKVGFCKKWTRCTVCWLLMFIDAKVLCQQQFKAVLRNQENCAVIKVLCAALFIVKGCLLMLRSWTKVLLSTDKTHIAAKLALLWTADAAASLGHFHCFPIESK